MKQIILPVALIGLLSTPLLAQEDAERTPPDDPGSSLMERGAELFLRGLQQEMAPALQDLQGFMQDIGPSMGAFLSQMGPALADIAREVEDWSVYEMPEILPNGDIIIRRKPDTEPPEDAPLDTVPDGEAIDI